VGARRGERLMAADNARMATSAMIRIANAGSCSMVRSTSSAIMP
jgi:hypothetical protein